MSSVNKQQLQDFYVYNINNNMPIKNNNINNNKIKKIYCLAGKFVG